MTRSHTRRKRELAQLKAARAAERAEARRRRKRIIASSVAATLVVVVAGTVAAIALTGGSDGKTSASTKPKPNPTAAAGAAAKTASCTYTADGKASKPVAKPANGTVAKTQLTAVITTNYGAMTATLDGTKAPCTVHALQTMATAKYFDNTPCHRETTSGIFVLQCGDPTGKGTGGPGYKYANENASAPAFERGVIAMANSGKDTNGSQFFINYKSTDATTAKQLAGQYSVIGKVTKGLDVLDKITTKGVQGGGQDGTPATKPQILSVTVTPATT